MVLPVYNEEGNLRPLFDELREALDEATPNNYEILFVDDGSRDASPEILRELAARSTAVRVIFFRRNFGQTAAMAAGLEAARGEVVVFMDSDRQNDPRDIGRLLDKIDDGYDVVCGWRKNRQDHGLTRVLPSKIANGLIRKVGGVDIHDLGCTLKAFRREVVKEIRLYGEMHRFIPIYADAVGARITELEVHHRPRVAGQTKYGLTRTFKVLLDLITVKFLITYASRPMHFFGAMSFLLLLGSGLTGTAMVLNKFINGISMIRSPLLLLSAVFLILSVNFVLLGILAEVQARIYFESQSKTTYTVREVLEGGAMTNAPETSSNTPESA